MFPNLTVLILAGMRMTNSVDRVNESLVSFNDSKWRLLLTEMTQQVFMKRVRDYIETFLS